MIAFISFPLMMGLMVTSDQVIRVIYGGKWTAVVPIFRILCITGLFQGIYGATGQLFVATGRTDRMLRGGVMLCAALSAAFCIGVFWGPIGMAASYVITLSLLILPYLSYCYATIGLRLKTVLAALRAPLISALVMALAVWFLRPPVGPGWHPVVRLAISGCIGVGAYLAVMLTFARPFMSEVVVATATAMVPGLRRVFGAAAERTPAAMYKAEAA
jgi:O-antigen/teichoic acid export membrane protein